MKICSRCYHSKDPAEFHKDRKAKDGRCCMCTVCNNSRAAKWYAAHRSRSAETGRRYYLGHKDESQTRSRQWVIDHRDRFNKIARQSSARRRSEIRQQAKYKWATDSQLRLYHRNQCRVYRAKKRRLTFSLTESQWQDVLNSYQYRCAFASLRRECESNRSGSIALHQAHAIAASRGGHHTRDNIFPACRSCNSAQGLKTQVEFAWRLLDMEY